MEPEDGEDYEDGELLIPESVAVRALNEKLGTGFKTVEEIIEHLKQNPKERAMLELSMNAPEKDESEVD